MLAIVNAVPTQALALTAAAAKILTVRVGFKQHYEYSSKLLTPTLNTQGVSGTMT